MYVSYLLEKESPSMYSGSVRHAGGLNLSAAQNFVGAPQYPDYGAYHMPAGIGLDNAQSPGSPWTAAYGAPLRDEWNGYGQAGAHGTAPAGALHGPSPAALAYNPAGDYLPHPHHPSQGPPAPPCGVPPSAGLMQPLNPPLGSDPLSPGGQRRNFCDWMRKPTAGGPGKEERAGRLYACAYLWDRCSPISVPELIGESGSVALKQTHTHTQNRRPTVGFLLPTQSVLTRFSPVKRKRANAPEPAWLGIEDAARLTVPAGRSGSSVGHALAFSSQFPCLT
uniref:Caudal-like activation domain-containing protein n=1 Tax=Naja naja TaxID=35670 RepID=A0A8C6YGK6_NAJNA